MDAPRVASDASGSPAVVCIGNEAGDIDSIVSAIVTAHAWPARPAYALAHFPREKFADRRDAVALFRSAGIQDIDAHLKFLPEASTDDVLKLAHGVVLTDHNALGASVAQRAEAAGRATAMRVLGIIDHHADLGSHSDAELRVVDPIVGSACSLVLATFFMPPNERRSAAPLTESLATLLFGVVLMDTRNLSKEKTSPIDVAVLEWLSNHPDFPEDEERRPKSKAGRKKLFDWIADARTDTQGMSPEDLLALDYKETRVTETCNLGMSSLQVSLDELQLRLQTVHTASMTLEQLVEGFCAERKLDLFLALAKASSEDRASKRKGMLVYTKNPEMMSRLLGELRAKPATPAWRFSSELLANPLVQTQGIPETGFDAEPWLLRSAQLESSSKSMKLLTVKGSISRKTLMPAVLEIARRSLQSL